jgi:hypothetical protein
MARKLIVREAFNGYVRGDSITDPAKVKAILESGNAQHVITAAGGGKE